MSQKNDGRLDHPIGVLIIHCTPCPEKHPENFSLYTVSQKNIPDIFDCNLKTNYQILIIFGKNILDTTCHQFPTSPNVCFCTTLGMQIKRNMC